MCIIENKKGFEHEISKNFRLKKAIKAKNNTKGSCKRVRRLTQKNFEWPFSSFCIQNDLKSFIKISDPIVWSSPCKCQFLSLFMNLEKIDL